MYFYFVSSINYSIESVKPLQHIVVNNLNKVLVEHSKDNPSYDHNPGVEKSPWSKLKDSKIQLHGGNFISCKGDSFWTEGCSLNDWVHSLHNEGMNICYISNVCDIV